MTHLFWALKLHVSWWFSGGSKAISLTDLQPYWGVHFVHSLTSLLKLRILSLNKPPTVGGKFTSAYWMPRSSSFFGWKTSRRFRCGPKETMDTIRYGENKCHCMEIMTVSQGISERNLGTSWYIRYPWIKSQSCYQNKTSAGNKHGADRQVPCRYSSSYMICKLQEISTPKETRNQPPYPVHQNKVRYQLGKT